MANKLFLLFNLGDERFAVSTELITEIIPLVELTKVPKTEPYICGLFNYRGETIAVIDTVMLLYNKPYNSKICTRIIVLTRNEGDCSTRVGLIAEKVNKTERYNTEQIAEHALTLKHTAYLGKTINDQHGEIQLIDLEKLIPQEANCLRSATAHS